MPGICGSPPCHAQLLLQLPDLLLGQQPVQDVTEQSVWPPVHLQGGPRRDGGLRVLLGGS